jgi:DNA primase
MSVVDEIKQKIDIVDVIGGYTKLQKAGRNYKAICPFHSEKTPSFFVFPEQQSWHCFGACSTGGDVFSFIMKKEGIDFSQALARLSERAGVILEPREDIGQKKEENKRLYDINEDASNYYHQLLLTSPMAQKAIKYIEKRGISQDITELFQLGYSKNEFTDLLDYLKQKGYNESEMLLSGLIIKTDNGVLHDRFKNRLMFSIRDMNGRYSGFGARALDDSMPKYMNSPQNPVFDKSSCLYGIDKARQEIRNKNEVIIVEGYMDVLTSHQFGWRNTVASMGTALTNKQVGILKRLTRNIILALDTDTAGEEATLNIAETNEYIFNLIDMEDFVNKEVKVVAPTGGKDPDEVIRKDRKIWQDTLEHSVSLIDFIFDLVKHKYDISTLSGKSEATNNILPIVSRIKDPIKKGEYIRRFAKIININENYLLDDLNKLKVEDRKKKTNRKNSYMKSASSDIANLKTTGIEDMLLSMLLQNPELHDAGITIPADYFEDSENVEIFKKWREDSNIGDIENNIDPVIYPHLESLLTKKHPPIEGMEDKINLIFYDYIDRLHEKHIRNALRRKAEVLASESGMEMQDDVIGKLEEQVAPEIEELKRIFTDRKQRRQIRA